MFKTISKVFSPEKLGEAIIKGIDNRFFTPEERAEMFPRLLKLYEPYKIAQRVLSIMFTGVFLFIHLVTAMTHILYVWRSLDAKPIIELYKYNNDNLGTIVLMIVGFYFAGGLLEGTVNKLRKRKKE